MQWKKVPLEVARWFVLVMLIAAPWAYGCTRDWAKRDLAYGLAGISGVGFVGLMLRGRWPRCSWWMTGPMAALLVQGWGMAVNAEKIFDPVSFAFYEVVKPVEWLPGVVDRAIVVRQMLLITGLIGCWVLATDLAANPVWRWRVWMTICLSGVSIVLLGLAERASEARGIFWIEEAGFSGTFFGSYRYHANAGAFINLVLPFILGAAVEAFRDPKHNVWKAMSVIGVLVISAAAFVNISRAAMSITMLLLAGFVVVAWHKRIVRRHQVDPGTVGMIIVLMLAGIVGLAWGAGLDPSMRKWTDGGSILQNDRYTISQLLIQKVLPVSGWWGFGAGTFSITFPFFTNEIGNLFAGIWKYAHEDYIQTIIEWGYIGAALWAFLVFGGLVQGVRKLFHLSRGERRLKQSEKEGRVFLLCCCFSLSGVLLHAAVDFPLQIASLQLYAAVVLGLAWGMAHQPSKEKSL